MVLHGTLLSLSLLLPFCKCMSVGSKMQLRVIAQAVIAGLLRPITIGPALLRPSFEGCSIHVQDIQPSFFEAEKCRFHLLIT